MNIKKNKMKNTQNGMIVFFSVLLVIFLVKNIYSIAKFVPQPKDDVSKDVAEINKFIAVNDEDKYLKFAENHKEFFNLQSVDIPIARKSPFLPLIDASKDDTEKTVLTNFTIDLTKAVQKYYDTYHQYPEAKAASTDGQTMIGTGEVDYSLVDMNTKDVKLDGYVFKIQKENPVKITPYKKDNDNLTEVAIQLLDINKFSLANIISAVDDSQVPKAAFLYDDRTVILGLGEQYMNIKLDKVDKINGTAVLQDTATEPVTIKECKK